jgi:hypothetical protein
LSLPVEEYHGFDAGWGGGLELALAKYAENPHIKLIKTDSLDEIRGLPEGIFNLGISLETLEHISPDSLDDVLYNFSMKVDGPCFFSVPNEIGVVFLLKHVAQTVIPGTKARPYKLSEIIYALLGQVEKIERNGHKGFSWKDFIEQVKRYFVIEAVDNIHLKGWPPSMAVSIGIVALPKEGAR